MKQNLIDKKVNKPSYQSLNDWLKEINYLIYPLLIMIIIGILVLLYATSLD